MAYRPTPFTTGEKYHLYNRGTEKRDIYLDKSDYNRFLKLLFLSNSPHSINVRDIEHTEDSIFNFDRGYPLVAIGSYCLMPNHFHLLVTPLVDDGVSLFMRKLGTSYSMYFNKKYERSGALFQGKFKSSHANTDEYLKYLYAYIHLNPVKLIQSDWKEVGIRDIDSSLAYLRSYRYSSFIDYSGKDRDEASIINPVEFPEYFKEASDHLDELTDWLQYPSLGRT